MFTSGFVRAFLSAALAASATLPAQVIISQLYGGGGNSGATYRYDFVELLNKGDNPVSLSGWCLQYASATGVFTLGNNQSTTLTGTIEPHRHYLVQLAQGTGGTQNLPTPDATGLTAAGATAGKFALLSSNCGTALAAGEGTSGGRIVDFVGYGTTANLFEGTGPAPAPSNTNAAMRGNQGCTDTNSNSADFSATPPNPRNSSVENLCGVVIPTLTSINAIQGAGSSSPLTGQSVTTQGIVTARKSNGFFLQNAENEYDANPATSEGIFVFTSSAPPATAAVGNRVQVTGSVVEFKGAATDPDGMALTEITGPTVSQLSTGHPLPAPIVLNAADFTRGGTDLEKTQPLERYEGMLVTAVSLTAVAPTQGSLSEANATSTSNGVFYAVLTGTARPFREPGLILPDALPLGAPVGTPRFDSNPERLRVDSDGITGVAAANTAAGTVFVNATGPLDFGFRTHTLLPTTPLGNPALPSAGAAPAPLDSEFTVASMNLQRFYDTADDPGGDTQLTSQAFINRLNKLSLSIRNVLNSPDIIAVQEAEHIGALQAIAAKLAQDDPSLSYQSFLVEGNDIGGIDVGYLVRGNRGITVDQITQEGDARQFLNPENNQLETTFDRPPLVLRATVTPPGGGASRKIIVVNLHLLALSNIETSARRRAKRKDGADFVAGLVQQLQASNGRVLVLGDYNAFEFNDGYVDVTGAIMGKPALPSEVLLSSPDVVNPDLTNLGLLLPASERYSYSFDGNAQTLDHALASQSLAAIVTRMAYGRSNADFPEIARNDAASPLRLTDHDHPVVYLAHAPTDATASLAIQEPAFVYNRTTRRLEATIKITNNGRSIGGPLQILVGGLPRGVTLEGSSGVEEGVPYITLQRGLDTGEMIQVPLRLLTNGAGVSSYSIRVLNGRF
ncbi:MAG: hypothetical protein FJW40_02140 [Acidobacteria bacterium]|nr:hypothetical protein [Acidobacteriota bacterium]